MAFQVTTEAHANTMGLDGRVYVLADGSGARAEVWPALGGNCFRWQAGGKDQLYADAMLFGGGKPTRSGIPVLFPFPNRVRGGHFQWAGKDYQLPLNDSSGKNAIHGFACFRPWRVVDRGASGDSAWVTCAFRGTVDAIDAMDRWPADYEIHITYRLAATTLTLKAQVRNPDRVPLPFGLGYHPYFLASPASLVEAPASDCWELEESLPTGKRKPVVSNLDLTRGRQLDQLKLDDVLTGLEPSTSGPHGLLRGKVRKPDGELRVWTGPDFRELVVFTPQNRLAVCLEPYTCTTDAINLQQQGIDAGLKVLQPGESWQGKVVLEAV